MKKNFFGIVMVGMILGTTTVFGKTNVNVHNDRFNNNRTEVVVINRHDKGMDRMVERRMMNRNMDRFMINHILEGRHIFGHHGECKVCHMDRHEIHKVERELRHHNNPRPVPMPVHKTSHFGR